MNLSQENTHASSQMRLCTKAMQRMYVVIGIENFTRIYINYHTKGAGMTSYDMLCQYKCSDLRLPHSKQPQPLRQAHRLNGSNDTCDAVASKIQAEHCNAPLNASRRSTGSKLINVDISYCILLPQESEECNKACTLKQLQEG